MDEEPKRFTSMYHGEYDETLDRKAAEDYSKEQRQEGRNEKGMEMAESLLKEEPSWSDEKIARIVKDISTEQVSSLRKGMKLV